MQKFTQKYTIVQLLEDRQPGDVFVMQDWPLHVTLADVFAIKGNIDNLIIELERRFSGYPVVRSQVSGEDHFGPDGSILVDLIGNTPILQRLHEDVVKLLEKYEVAFNNPQYTYGDFKPHSTVKDGTRLAHHQVIDFDALTLIDLFPGGDPAKRQILATVSFRR